MKLFPLVVCSVLLAAPVGAASVSFVSGAGLDYSASPLSSTDGNPADLMPLIVERFGQATCSDLLLVGPGTLTGECSGGTLITNVSENTQWRVGYARAFYAVIRASLDADKADFLINASATINYTAGPVGRPDLSTDVGGLLTFDSSDIVDGVGDAFAIYSGIPLDGEATLLPTSSPLLLEYSFSFSATISDPAPVPLPSTGFLLLAGLPLLRLARSRSRSEKRTLATSKS